MRPVAPPTCERLAGVLLHVGPLDLDPEGAAVVQLDVEVAVEAIGSSYCEVWKFFGMSG